MVDPLQDQCIEFADQTQARELGVRQQRWTFSSVVVDHGLSWACCTGRSLPLLETSTRLWAMLRWRDGAPSLASRVA